MRRFSPTKSLTLNGTNEYFTLGTGFNFTNGSGTDTAFSITGWFFFPDATSRGLVSKRSVWEFALNPSDQVVVNIYTSGVIYIGRTTAALTSLQNQWVHLAMTYSGSETNSGVKIYVNGGRADTADSSAGSYTGMPSSTTTVTLGALEATLRWFGGYMGRVCIWNKELSDAEVKEDLTTHDLNFHSAKSNIRNWYDPETFDGTTLIDRKGGENGTGVNVDSTNLVTGAPNYRRYQARADGETPIARFGGLSWDLDGTNEYILLPDSNSLSFGNGTSDSAFSFSCLLKLRSISQCVFFSKWTVSTGREYIFYIQSGNFIQIFFRDESASKQINRISTTGIITTGNWHHIVVTYSGVGGSTAASEINIYVNGQNVSSTATNDAGYVAMENLSSNATIGCHLSSGSPGSLINGQIADVIIFGKELTSSEVLQVYNSGQPRNELNTNLSSSISSYWRPYNSTNTASGVIDQSGNGLHGTMTNMESLDLQDGFRRYPRKLYDSSNKGSFDFDGTNEYIDIADSSLLTFGNGTTDSPFSISAFVRMDDATTFRLFNKGGSTTSNIEYNFGTNAGDAAFFQCYSNNPIGRLICTSTTTLTSQQGQWLHMVATYSGSATSAGLNMYLNGTIMAVTKGSTGTYESMEDQTGAQIGTISGVNYANGLISNVCVWSKELSAIEVEELYNNGAPIDPRLHSAAVNLVEWWKLDATDSPTAANGVIGQINGINGTGTNMESGDLLTTAGNYPTV